MTDSEEIEREDEQPPAVVVDEQPKQSPADERREPGFRCDHSLCDADELTE